MILGIVVFATLCIIVFNLIVDLLYAVDRPADPAHLMALLEVSDLRTSFRTDDGIVQAVDGVSLLGRARARRSGSSASPAAARASPALTIMGLNNPRNATSSGEALFDGEDLLAAEPGSPARSSAATRSR